MPSEGGGDHALAIPPRLDDPILPDGDDAGRLGPPLDPPRQVHGLPAELPRRQELLPRRGPRPSFLIPVTRASSVHSASAATAARGGARTREQGDAENDRWYA